MRLLVVCMCVYQETLYTCLAHKECSQQEKNILNSSSKLFNHNILILVKGVINVSLTHKQNIPNSVRVCLVAGLRRLCCMA